MPHPLLPETRSAELMRYVRWTADDDARLTEFHRVAAPHFITLADEFYERIREHVAAHAVLRDEAQIRRLQQSLVAWMERVCTGRRDAAYFEETSKIGRVHVKVGLPQRYVLTAMALIRMSWARIADQELPDRAIAIRETITRALDLELATMLESYHDDFVARLHRIEQVERATMGRALARNEHLYVHAVERAPYLVVGLDEQGCVMLFNRAAEKATGFARDEAFGRALSELLVRDEVQPEVAAQVAAMIASKGRGAPFDAPLFTKSGKTRLVRWQVAYAPAGDADDVALFAIGRDVTDDAALAERTRRAEKLAAVGTLAAGLAHEIRNPLNGAHLHLTFLERGLRKSSAAPDALEAVGVVGDEIKRLSSLVNEFLDFARPKPLERRPTTVRLLCEHALGIVAADGARARVSVVLDLPSAEIPLEVDAAKIQQVLLNLLQNGIEASEAAGSQRVTLRARRTPISVTVEVIDEGAGIPAAHAPIFDAFYTTKSSGTGLGLSIVHRIVTDHDGTISFDSRPGHTVFRITLPLETSA